LNGISGTSDWKLKKAPTPDALGLQELESTAKLHTKNLGKGKNENKKCKKDHREPSQQGKTQGEKKKKIGGVGGGKSKELRSKGTSG